MVMNGTAPEQLLCWAYDDGMAVAPPPGTGHLHWVVQGYVRADEHGQMRDSIVIEVEAEDERSAIARAMRVVKRPYYRVASVRETCALDRDLARARRGQQER